MPGVNLFGMTSRLGDHHLSSTVMEGAAMRGLYVVFESIIMEHRTYASKITCSLET